MSSHNKEWLEEWHKFNRGEGCETNRNLYIKSVIEHYGSDYAKAFDTKVCNLIIEKDSFFTHISSEDTAEILKTAESYPKKKATPLLTSLFSGGKYEFQDKDGKKVIPQYKDSSLKGKYGLNKGK